MKNSLIYFVCIYVSLTCLNVYSQAGADSLLNFIKQNKSRSALFLKKNDTVIARLNEDKIMTVAGIAKMIIAIEFAKQASHDIFDKNKKIPLSDLDRYYIAGTDGNAHTSWISYEKNAGNIINDSVKLIDVAKGMIVFSSNANSEYLMDMLGFDNVNNNLQLLGLTKHTPIYPIVSSLLLYQNPKNLKEEKLLKEIKKLSSEEYANYSLLIHRELKLDSTYRKKFRPGDITLNVRKEWSKRLPASTTKEYVQVCAILNNRKYFDESTYYVLGDILETAIENPGNKSWLNYAGMTGGSTPFVFTKALYATLKDGTKIELAYFFNDISGQENSLLQKWMNDFELKVLTDESFRMKIVL